MEKESLKDLFSDYDEISHTSSAATKSFQKGVTKNKSIVDQGINQLRC